MTLVQRRLIGLGTFVLVGGLGALAALWQARHSEEKLEEKSAAEKVLALDKVDEVQSITLTTPAGRFVLNRQAPTGDAAWKITSPIETLAEKSSIDGLLGQLSQLRRSREVGEKNDDGTTVPPTDLKIFELDPPRFTVSVTSADGTTEELHVGKKSSFDGSLFVQVAGKPQVSVVPGALEYQVDRDLFKLREKRLAIFDADLATRLTVTYTDGTSKKPTSYVVEKNGSDFVFEEPRVMPADPAQINGILSALAGVRAKSFVAEHATAEELKKCGLDRPTAQVVVSLKEGAPVTLLFSEVKTGSTTSYFAAESGDHPILELSSEWAFKKAMSNVDDLRDKRVLKLDRDAVKKVVLTKGEVTLAFEKRHDAAKDRDTWHMTQPADRPVSDATLTGMIYNLSNLRGERVLSWTASDADWRDAGLDKPELTVVLTGEGDAALSTLFVAGTKDGGRIVASAKGGRIDVVDANRVSDISTNPDDYKDPGAEPAPEPEP